jgi:hypothetical protein
LKENSRCVTERQRRDGTTGTRDPHRPRSGRSARRPDVFSRTFQGADHVFGIPVVAVLGELLRGGEGIRRVDIERDCEATGEENAERFHRRGV